MKIYIGKYTNYRTNFAERYFFKKVEKYSDKKISVGDDFKGIDKLIYSSLEKLDDISVYFYKYFTRRERKIKIRIDDYDVWNADNTLAMIIHPILVKLKEVKHGSPHVKDEDVPDHLKDGDILMSDPNSTATKVHEKWEWVIDEMIFAFECLKNDDWTDQFYSDDYDIQFEEICNDNEEKFHTLVRKSGHVDEEGIKLTQERINNGLRLFATYYTGLWD